MKTPEEILFDKMQPDEEGKINPLTDEQIIQSMKEYTVEVITDYILHSTHCGSKFEAQRAAKMYYDKIEKL